MQNIVGSWKIWNGLIDLNISLKKKNNFHTNRFKVFYILDRLFIVGQENSAVRAFYKLKTSPFS